ncbi:MAG: imidazoleglycerol-phosphate dehydratase HisB [Clostridia bacterium]
MRTAKITRKTSETEITLSLNLDGSGICETNSGCGFFDHMMTLFAKHGKFDLNLNCLGDVYVDYHHSIEDIGIALGTAFSQAAGDLRGIIRYADIILPMDEALVMCACDISGRSFLNYSVKIPSEKVGDFDTELTEEFFSAFVRCFPISLHIKCLEGKNSHHIIEAIFKAFARVMSKSVSIDEKYKNEIPSTKGILC